MLKVFVRGLILCGLLFVVSLSHAKVHIIERESFGLHSHTFARGGAWPKVPFGFIRLWDAQVRWKDLEPVNNQWDFSELDVYVNKAHLEGTKVLMTLGQPPRWAAKYKNSKGVYGLGANSPPNAMAEWIDYVTTLAERYKGKIRYWELWNEVNVPHFYSGSWAELVALEKVTSEVLKKIDSGNQLLTASIQGGAFGSFEKYLAAGGGTYSDIISYHFYAPLDFPEIVPERIRKIRSIMVRYAMDHKPLWNTEVGWLLENSDGMLGPNPRAAWESWKKISYREAPGIVIRNFLMNFYAGVERVFWYSWDNRSMGLAEQKGHIIKPAAWGYRTAVNWLIGSEFKGCIEVKEIWTCRLTKNNQNNWIVWTIANTVEGKDFIIPKSWGVEYYQNSLGQEFLLENRLISLTSQPVLFYKRGN